ncbi:MAG: helix-turn-helix transcriptional regulator [Myxococcota bacterium]
MAAIDVISANLPVLRELRGRMTQNDLAERVGVSRRTIARLESGEVADPGVDLTGRIAQELGVTLSQLTEAPLELVRVPIPTDLRGELQRPEALEAIVRTLRHR